jgi:putative protease
MNKETMPTGRQVGKVIHYFDRAMVAVIRLEDNLSVGDSVKFVHGDSEFTQTIDSMEVEHEKIQSAKKGDEVAVKVEQKTREGARVCRVE